MSLALEFALLIVIFATIVVSATFFSHVFSELTRLPRLIFYIIVGLIIGPLFLNLLNPDSLLLNEGQFLEAVIAVAVAVIVFEGGYSFNRCLPHEQACSPIEFRRLIGNVLRLSLIGGFITAALMTLTFLLVAAILPPFALLMGVLTMITGPTVINPVVRRLGIKEDVAFTLEGEGLINDAIGVILASAIFTAILASLSGLPVALPLVVTINLLIGIFAGFVIGIIGVFISQWIGPRFLSRFKGKIDTHSLAHLSRIGMLIAAFAAFALAEYFVHHSGIIAALIAGIMLGNRDKFGIGPEIDWTDYESYDMRHHIEEGVHTFQSDLVQLAIASVFLLLTAFITWDLLFVTLFTPFFLAGIVVVGLLILVIRPLSVMLSTIRTKFTLRERIFMSFFGPRGIVIAATGVFFSITLVLNYGIDYPLLKGYIFLIVLMTVIIQAGLAPVIARTCDVCTVQYGEPNAAEDESSLNPSTEES
jgi:NhaP-type Na+/H+ or K+/H+ antiporter